MTDKTKQHSFTVTTAAEQLQASKRTVRRWIETGEFPNAYKLSPLQKSPYRIPVEDLEEFKKRRQTIQSP